MLNHYKFTGLCITNMAALEALGSSPLSYYSTSHHPAVQGHMPQGTDISAASSGSLEAFIILKE